MSDGVSRRASSRRRKPVEFFEAGPASFQTPGDFAVPAGPPRKKARSKSVSVGDSHAAGDGQRVWFPTREGKEVEEYLGVLSVKAGVHSIRYDDDDHEVGTYADGVFQTHVGGELIRRSCEFLESSPKQPARVAGMARSLGELAAADGGPAKDATSSSPVQETSMPAVVVDADRSVARPSTGTEPELQKDKGTARTGQHGSGSGNLPTIETAVAAKGELREKLRQSSDREAGPALATPALQDVAPPSQGLKRLKKRSASSASEASAVIHPEVLEGDIHEVPQQATSPAETRRSLDAPTGEGVVTPEADDPPHLPDSAASQPFPGQLLTAPPVIDSSTGDTAVGHDRDPAPCLPSALAQDSKRKGAPDATAEQSRPAKIHRGPPAEVPESPATDVPTRPGGSMESSPAAAQELEGEAPQGSGRPAGAAEKDPDSSRIGAGKTGSSVRNLARHSQKTAIGLAPGLLSLSQMRPSSQTLAQSSPRATSTAQLDSPRIAVQPSVQDVTAQEKDAIKAKKARKAEEAESVSLREQMGRALSHLSRAKESIAKATSLAISGVRFPGLAASFMRDIVDHMQKETAGNRRINLLYLVDSIVQMSQRPGRPGCGPGSEAAKAYPKVAAAALSRLVSALSAEVEGREKAEKVLKLWLDRKLLPESVVKVELQQLREVSAACTSAAKHVVMLPHAFPGVEAVKAELDNQYGSMNLGGGLRIQEEGGPTMSLHMHLRDEGEDWGEDDDDEVDDGQDDYQASPASLSQATAWRQPSDHAPGDLSEGSPWHTGASEGPSPIGTYSSGWPSTGYASHVPSELERGNSDDGLEVPNAYDPHSYQHNPPMEAPVPTSVGAHLYSASLHGIITVHGASQAADDWDAPGNAPAQSELGGLPPGLSSTFRAEGVSSAMPWAAAPGVPDLAPPGLGMFTAAPKHNTYAGPLPAAPASAMPVSAHGHELHGVLPGFGTATQEANYSRQWETPASTYTTHQQLAQPLPVASEGSARLPHAEFVPGSSVAHLAAAQSSSYRAAPYITPRVYVDAPVLAGDPPRSEVQYDAALSSYQPDRYGAVGPDPGPAPMENNSMPLPGAHVDHGTWSELPVESYSPGADEHPPLPDGLPPLPDEEAPPLPEDEAPPLPPEVDVPPPLPSEPEGFESPPPLPPCDDGDGVASMEVDVADEATGDLQGGWDYGAERGESGMQQGGTMYQLGAAATHPATQYHAALGGTTRTAEYAGHHQTWLGSSSVSEGFNAVLQPNQAPPVPGHGYVQRPAAAFPTYSYVAPGYGQG